VISVSVSVLLLEFNRHSESNSDLGGQASEEIWNMSKPVVEVQVRAVAAVSAGCAVFLGNEDKVFVMFVDQSVGAAITMFMQGTQKERPLTHDLLANILRALGAKIDRVVVNDLKNGTYFARLVLSAENETQQKKIIEIDARPSDCIAMATQQSAPIFVSLDVWDEVEDMTEVLRKIQQEGSDTEQSDEEEES
jgi:bifunctional DNase/RNase